MLQPRFLHESQRNGTPAAGLPHEQMIVILDTVLFHAKICLSEARRWRGRMYVYILGFPCKN